MHAIDTATAVDGQFIDGDVYAGIPATSVDSSWLNDFQNNMLAVLAAANVAPTKGNPTDLATAIADLIATAVAAIPSGGGSGGSSPAPNQLAAYGFPTRAAIPNGAQDLNLLLTSGFYAAPAGTAHVPATAGAGVVMCSGNANTGEPDGAQLYVENTTGRLWARGCSADVWSAWSLLSTPQFFFQGGPNGASWNGVTGEFSQWGLVQGPYSEGEVNIAYPYAFDACDGIHGWVVNTSADISIGTWIDEVSVAAGSAIVLVNRVSSGSDNIPAFRWRAHGSRAAYPVLAQQSGSGGGGSNSGGGSGGGVQP